MTAQAFSKVWRWNRAIAGFVISIIKGCYTVVAVLCILAVRQFVRLLADANRIIALGTIALALGTIALGVIGYFGLRDARIAFETGSRAWVAPTSATLTKPLENGKPINFVIGYDNVGKLPATDLHEHYTLYSFDNAEIDNGTAMAQIDKNDICEGVEPWKDADVVYPSVGGIKMKMSIKPTDPTTGQPTPLYTSFMSGNHSLVVYMCIAYQSLATPHHSAFCYFYRPGVSEENEFGHCDKGNKAD